MTAVAAAFEDYLARLVDIAGGEPDVVGLVGFGSTADRSRVDEWSDHDFAWLTVPGAEDRYRHDLSWLPDAHRIALSVVESHGGVKVVYDDGHVLEFGIDSLDGFARWLGNRAEVLVDKGGVAEAVAAVLAKPVPGDGVVPEREIRLFFTQLLIGVGRVRRGEVTNGSHMVRTEAVQHLLAAVAVRVAPAGDPMARDTLDVRRRLERVHPTIASAIEEAVRLDADTAARRLLDLAERELAPGWDGFPTAAVAAVRARLGWT
ncbi:hypothetical protein [Desertimonas flava]|uniref:hypothetical protein n=1 Tax=Desertimonas flava TaxID=2064846 RepID=UPI000E3473A9|nr:hypothetical protein [Desertimonas flava]